MVAQSLPSTPASDAGGVRYTIATLLTDPAQYAAMRKSFEAGGFTAPETEFLIVDNSKGNVSCAYRGLNRLLGEAHGAIVILCHQDVRLIADGRNALDDRLDELDARDPLWAVAGNAGGCAPGRLALRISDPHCANQHIGRLPARVQSLDENFIIVRRSARVGFSNDLSGFHFYGADICLTADLMGYSCFVIDFHLQHLSPGNKDASFAEAERRFIAKWSHALRGRWLQTTCSLVYLSGGGVAGFIANRVRTLVSSVAWRIGRSTGSSGGGAWPAAAASGDKRR